MTPAKAIRPPHSVYFYQDEGFLLNKLQSFVREGLSQQETVILIATDAHRTSLRESLWPELVAYPYFIEADADRLLATFYCNGHLRTDRFFPAVHAMFAQAHPFERPIRIYGEMVMLLWRQGFRESALELEGLWNDLRPQYQFSMLCGYHLVEERVEDVNGILRLHSHLDLGASTKVAL